MSQTAATGRADDCIFVAVALYDFSAVQPNHLSLHEGDHVRVLSQEASGWWSGVSISDGRSGWFPASYVERVLEPPDTHVPVQAPSPLDSPPPTPIDWDVSNEAWAPYTTDDGQTYYVNHTTGESRWTLPTSALTPHHSPTPPPAPTAVKPAVTARRSTMDDYNSVTLAPPIEFPRSRNVSRADLQAATYNNQPYTSPPTPEPQPAMDRSPRYSVASSVRNSRCQSMITSDSRCTNAVSFNGKFGYMNNFWSDKGDKSGFDILVLKHRNGKEMCKDIVQLMSERAKIEETYAKSLLELAKLPLGDMESGTTKTAWNQLKFDLESQARFRLEFARKTISDVEQPLLSFKNEQKKLRKNYEATIAADRKTLLAKYQVAIKMQRIYQSRARDAEVADAMFARSTGDSTKRDVQKLEDNARRERKKAGIASLDYKNAVEEYERIRLQWEEDMQTACYEFQQAEEERIDYTKVVLRKFMDIQKDVNSQCKESSEMAESSINAVSKEVDIEMFVKSHFTGNQRPIPLQFEQYKQYC